MRVKITCAAKKITEAVLIEGRTWARAADLLEHFGAKSEWEEGEHFHTLRLGVLPEKQQMQLLGTRMNAIRVSENFWLHEFECKGVNCGCNNAVKLHPELAKRLQAMRTETGLPIHVRSGYRCPTHNRIVGSSSDSQHPRGTAADIEIIGMALQEQYDLAERHFPDGGVGTGASWGVHVDVRGHRARWTYS